MSGRTETKTIRLYMGKRLGGRDAKKLAKLLDDGWTILHETDEKTWFGQDNHYVTYVLTRER